MLKDFETIELLEIFYLQMIEIIFGNVRNIEKIFKMLDFKTKICKIKIITKI